VGDIKELHTPDKADVGIRLALAARHVAYGQDIVYSGPIYDSMKIEGSKIRVTFKNVGSGLTIGAPPWTPADSTPETGNELENFTIAGADKKWVPAQARIDGNSVVVWSDAIADPVAVRYGWADSPQYDLYNKEKLPAAPFRTDDWAP
jgi:sialate O-acetylesterase